MADEKLFRDLSEKRNIRIELAMKDAAKWFKNAGPDISEIYSPPRIVQEAGLRTYAGTKLRPGWSLDLTTDDPETGTPWDLSDGKGAQRRRRTSRHSARGQGISLLGS